MTWNGHQKKYHFPKTDSCNENARFFFTVWTQIVFACFSKKWHFYKKKTFFSQPPKKHYFSGLFCNFPFPFFSYCPFHLFQHKKDKNKKCTFFFENPFLTPWQTAKKLFSHPYTLFVFFLDQQKNTIKLGKKQAKKILDGFSTQPWTDFQLKNPQILDGFSTLQHIYIYIYIYICLFIYLFLYMYIHSFFWGGGIIFVHRNLYSIIFLGGLIIVM